MNRPFLSFVLLVVVTLLPLAQGLASGSYVFKHVDSSMGLSSGNVKCITEDSYGFMWLGTKNGLHRYDGLGMKRFDCFDYEKRRGNNNIGALYEDENKLLWVGTDRGVYIYDPVADSFSLLDQRDRRTGALPDNWVQTIDGDREGNVWVCLPDVGVFHFYGEQMDHYTIASLKESFKRSFPSDLCVDSNGDVWVTTVGLGIYRFNKRAKRFERVTGEGADDSLLAQMALVKEDTDGTLIFSSSSVGLLRYDPQNKRFSKVPFTKGDDIYIRCLQCFDTEIWVGAQDGLYIIDKATGSTVKLNKDPKNPFSLSDDIIYYLYESRNGDAWVGTSFGGADFMVRNKFKFEVYGNWSGFTGNVVNGMAQAADGKIWIGSEANGIYIFDPATGQATPAPEAQLQGKTVLGLTRFNGNLFIGISKGGLVKIDRNGALSRVAEEFKETDNSVYSYLRDSRGNEWAGLGFALFRRDAGRDEFVRVNETAYDWIFSIFEAHDGTVWLASMGNGLWKYNPTTGKFKSYVYSEDNGNGLRSNSISAFMEDSRGNIWVSTDRGGISRYNKAEDNFTSFGIEEGLPDDVAYNILEDSHGNLWFGTNKGLVKFNPDTRAVRTFTMKDGLPHNQFNYNSALKANDGLFYFGGINGFVAFNPDMEDNQAVSPSIYFTRLQIFNEEVTVATEGSPLKENIMFTRKLTLPYSASTFSLDVVAPSLGVAGGCEYSYKLEPASKEWVQMQNHRISFANVSPGDYTLRVRALNYGNDAFEELEITILPPWWASWWAYTIYVLLVIAAVAAWFVWYRGHKERQLQERQRLFAANKEKELYQNKIQFFTEVAHEIRTPLALIDAPLEAIEEIGTGDKRVQHYLKVTRQNTRRLLNLTGQLLDFQKIDSNRLAFKYENVDVCALVNETADRFEPSIMLKGKSLSRQVPDEPIIASTDKEAVTKILSNLFNNAQKYARHAIKVTLEADDINFKIRVTSDGDKITDEDRARIFERFYQIDKSNSGENGVGIGLPLSRSLAQLLGGLLTLDDTTDDDGNTFVATIPLNKDGIVHNNKAAVDTSDYLLDENSNQAREQTDGYTVLIVEDNDTMREFLAEQSCMSFTVEMASNGKEALEKLANSRIDLIVTDVMMPVMNGFELCKAVKADINLSHIPIVFITAKNDLESKIEGLQLGAEAYIEKPFSIKYFRQLIRSLLDNRRREREAFSKKPFFNVDSMHMTKADEEFMGKVVKIIEENVGQDDFNVETMADILCMSHSRLLRKIKSVFNMSPVELIRTVKLKKAAELIQEGKHLIGDICYMVGIASPSYFSKLFFKQFGVSPKDFEKQCREKAAEKE